MSSTVHSRKVARMDFRVPVNVQETIQKAAAISGVSVTDFLTKAAFDTAAEIIARQDEIVLRGRDRDIFLTALEHPPRANKPLRDLLRKAKKQGLLEG